MTSVTCCAGTITTEEFKGSERKFADYNCYVSKKEGEAITEKVAFVFITDVFGYKLPNGRVLADCYAEKSNGAVLSVIPDLFNGTEVSPSMMATFHTLMSKESGFFSKAGSVFVALYNLPSFFYRNPPAKSQAKIIEVIKDLRANHGIEKVGVIGYCYGGTIAIKLAQADDDLIDCYAANHAGGVKVPEDIVVLKKPGAIIYAEIDVAPVKDIFPKVEDLIKNQPSVNPTIVKSYNEMHGFAIRGDDKVESTRTAKYEVVDLTSKLFKEILKY